MKTDFTSTDRLALKKELVEEVNKTLKDAYDDFQKELDSVAERLNEQHLTFVDQQKLIDVEIQRRIGKLEAKPQPQVLDLGIPPERIATFMAGQQKVAAALKAAKLSPEAQLLLYAAADEHVKLMDLKGKTRNFHHVETRDAVVVILAAACVGSLATSSLLYWQAKRELKKAGRTPEEVRDWLNEKRPAAENPPRLKPATIVAGEAKAARGHLRAV